MSYLFHILITINLYVMLGMSLNLATGYTGLVSLCHAAFYGVGAYVTTLLMVSAGWGFLPAAAAAMVLTPLLSLVIAVPSLRLRGDYFVLATLGFQMIVFTVLYNWVDLTGGPFGIAGIPRPRLLGVEIDSPPRFFVLTLCAAAACALLVWVLARSPFGRVLRAIREDEVAAAALGKDIPRLKVLSFAIAACLAALPGALFAVYARYIDPTSFVLTEAIFILSIVIIGGAGSLVGPIAGAVLMVLLPELLRFLQVPDTLAANTRQIIYGLLLIVMMRYRPRGLLGRYGFD